MPDGPVLGAVKVTLLEPTAAPPAPVTLAVRVVPKVLPVTTNCGVPVVAAIAVAKVTIVHEKVAGRPKLEVLNEDLTAKVWAPKASPV